MDLETKASLPVRDCNSVLVADLLLSHLGNKSVCNSKGLSGVTDTVKFVVSKRTPRQLSQVDRGQALCNDSCNPNACSNEPDSA